MLYILVMILAAMMVLGTVVPAFADVEDYIKATCEDNGGEWNDKNMACNNFESQGEQWNFADALMDREEYDKLVKYCENSGEWSDEQLKCIIEDEEERTYFEDAVCDDGSTKACQLSQNLILGEAFASSASEEEEHCEDNGGEWSKEDKECDIDDKEDYNKKKYKDFANKPENRGYSDWEYPESDK